MPVSGVIWEVRTTGNDTNGGGFVAGASGTDFSQQDAPLINVTDAVANGTTTITSATAGFTSALIGNVVYLVGGSGSLAATRRTIASVTNSTTAVLNATVAAGTNITFRLGGSLATPGLAGGVRVAGNVVYIRSGTYTLTSATANVSGGRVLDSIGGLDNGAMPGWVGYDVTRTLTNRDPNRPVIHAGSLTSLTPLTFTNSTGQVGPYVSNIIIDGNSGSGNIGLNCLYGQYVNIWSRNCPGGGVITGGAGAILSYCRASGNGTAGFSASNAAVRYEYCESHDNTGPGFVGNGQISYYCCLSRGNTGASSDGFQFNLVTDPKFHCVNCTAYGNGRSGFRSTNLIRVGRLTNCIATNNLAFGYELSPAAMLETCAGFGNTSGHTSGNPTLGRFISLTADPFTNAPAGDLSLNTVSGGGALLRSVGFPGATPTGTATAFADVGAVQSQPTASTGGVSGSRIFTGF
jgi:hypothetical protein